MTQFATALPILLAVATQTAAQAAPADPQFEVASVKPANPGPRGVWTDSPIRIRMMNMSLKELVAFAFDLKDYQLAGLAWIDSERFDIFAKTPSEVADLQEAERWRQKLAMIRSLLADRFKLAVHRESKDLPVYALVIAKNGAKIQEIGPDSGYYVKGDIHRGHIAAQRMPMSQLVDILKFW